MDEEKLENEEEETEDEEETSEDEEETKEETSKEEESEESEVSEKKVDSFNREMHKAVCAECKKECEVPFKPSGGRPVYCRDCYRKHAPQRRY